jgi:putative N-acetylmannosamine-6-phosphate epimerase
MKYLHNKLKHIKAFFMLHVKLSSLLEQKIATITMIEECLEKPITGIVRRDFEKEEIEINAQIKLLRYILENSIN